MNRIAALSSTERRAVFNEAGVSLGLPPYHVEKDFWVCWVLRTLFEDADVGPHLTFRGGTSLSKGWGLIERFSEDIDLAMARSWLCGVRNPAESGISNAELRLSCVRPERTFWEKAALVHEQNARPETRALAPRQARHLYDLIRLWDRVAGTDGLHALFDGVKAHRSAFFNYAWVDYEALRPADLRLVPAEERTADWRADYQAMRLMFFRDPPSFDDILSGLKAVEEGLRQQ